MIHVEPVELAVADDIDAGLLLGVDHHARSIDERLLGGQGDEPFRNRVRPDNGGLDTRRFSHGLSSAALLNACGDYNQAG